MNRAQLDALLALGLITAEQHSLALSTRNQAGLITARPALDLHVAAQSLELPAEEETDEVASRTLHGVFSAYEEYIPSHGMILHTGSLVARQPLNRFKVLRDHNMTDPLGYVTAYDVDTLEGDLFIARDSLGNGDRALEDVRNGIRDGLSVGFQITDYDFDEDWTLHVWLAEVYEVSLCAIPAVADAGIYSVAAALAATRKENTTMNRAQLAAALAAGTITQEAHDTRLAAVEASEAAPTVPVAPELAAGPEAVPTPPALQITDRSLSLREVTRRVATAANTGEVHQVALVLADIIPANDAGEAYANRPEWLGELFTATQETRPYIDAIGPVQPLAALRAKGWRWGDRPEVEEYDGNKEEVPTGGITTLGDDFVAFRVAAGWDIDRAFIDFGDETFLADFWRHVTSDYQIKSEAGIRTRLKALKANAAGTVAVGGVLALLKQLIRDGRSITGAGVKVNRIFLSDSMFEELEDIPTEELPLWLKSAVLGMDIADGTANVGELRIGLDSTLLAGEAVAFDNRGLIVRERQIPQIRAIDVAKGGIDLGFTSYLRLDDVDPRLVFRRRYIAA